MYSNQFSFHVDEKTANTTLEFWERKIRMNIKECYEVVNECLFDVRF